MQQGQDKGGDSGDFGLIIMIAGIVLFFGWLIWNNFHTQIVFLTTSFRRLLLLPIGVVNGNAATVAAKLAEVDYSQITAKQWTRMLQVSGMYVRWLIVPIIGFLAWRVYSKAYTTRFSRRHSMKSLVNQEKAIWPEIAPISGLDLVSQNPEAGIWASAMSEREFARLHKLINVKTGEMDYEKAEKVFAGQLGRLWTGIQGLRPHEKAMFALFAARIGGDPDHLQYARRMAATFRCTVDSFDISKMDMSWVDGAIEKHGSHPLVQKAVSRHAWVYTVLCTLLQISRTDGVFASPLWIWLKPVDRNLFYALNCVGRYADFAEVGGVCAQWLAEKRFGLPIGFPDVKSAVVGLDKSLKNFCDDDTLERIFK